MVELVVFLGVALVVGVVGIRVGMLLAPRLSRLTEHEREDEEDRGRD